MRKKHPETSQKKIPPDNGLYRLMAANRARTTAYAKKKLADPTLDQGSSVAASLRIASGTPRKRSLLPAKSKASLPAKPAALVSATRPTKLESPAQKYAHYRTLKGNARFEYYLEHTADIFEGFRTQAETSSPGKTHLSKLSPRGSVTVEKAGVVPQGTRPPQSVPDGFRLTNRDRANLEKLEKWQSLDGEERQSFFSKHADDIWSARDLIRRANR